MGTLQDVGRRCMSLLRRTKIFRAEQAEITLKRNTTARSRNTYGSLFKLFGTCALCGYSTNLLLNSSWIDRFTVRALDSDKPRLSVNFLADIVEEAQPALVTIEVIIRHPGFIGQGKSAGSGFIVREDGLILTNAHVVSRQEEVQVKLQDGRVLTGHVQAVDTVTDLATVKIDGKNLPTLKLGKSSASRPGEFVIAMGSPLFLSNSVTHGIISSVHRGSDELGMHNRDMAYIQTDAVITKGNSGGPLINMNGEVIGINTLNVISGISFAIPSDKASEFLRKAEQLERKASKRGTSWFTKSGVSEQKVRYIGITMFTLDRHYISEIQARMPNFPQDIKSGVLIPSVTQGSPAHRAGLLPGDIIVKINDKPVSSSSDVTEALKLNSNLIIDAYRQNKKYQFTVIPEAL